MNCRLALILALVLRLVYSVAAGILARHLHLDPVLVRSNALTDHLMAPGTWMYTVLGVWERFDTLWYLHIAAHGYDRVDSIVFYPLYPLLIRAASILIGSPLAAALAISTAACWFLFWGFLNLFALDRPDAEVRRGMFLLAIWPASFMLFAGYPESVLIALSIWSIYWARRDRWPHACVAAFLAGLTKAAGILVAPALFVIAWRSPRPHRLPRFIGAAVAALAAPAFGVWARLSGFPPTALVYARYWRTHVELPWDTIAESIRAAPRGDLLLILNLTALLAVLAIAGFGKMRLEYTCLALSAVWLFSSKHTSPLLQSTMRYALTAFPVYARFGAWLRSPLILAFGGMALFFMNVLLLRGFVEWSLVV